MLDLERFSPQPFVSKLLGMGDMAGLVEHVQALKLDQKDTMKHLSEGIFTIRDLRDQLQNIMKMGPLSKMAGMIPGLGQMMGGMGYSSETHMQRYWRDARLYKIGPIANEMARNLVTPPHRSGGQAQYIRRPLPTGPATRLGPLLDWMRGSLAESLSIAQLSARAGMSARTFCRCFGDATGMAPGALAR